MRSSSRRRAAWCRPRSRSSDNFVEIRVADNGRGIRPDFLGLIFDRFRRADAGTTRGEGGLGLGLAIARQLVEMHGGTLTAASDGENQGATFLVKLPRQSIATPDRRSTRTCGHIARNQGDVTVTTGSANVLGEIIRSTSTRASCRAGSMRSRARAACDPTCCRARICRSNRGRFLTALQRGRRHPAASTSPAPPYASVRQQIEEMSVERARQGYTPTRNGDVRLLAQAAALRPAARAAAAGSVGPGRRDLGGDGAPRSAGTADDRGVSARPRDRSSSGSRRRCSSCRRR